MTYDEAVEILTQVSACWPKFSTQATEESMDRWAKDLMSLDYEIAHKAVGRLHESLLMPPAWSQFIECYRSLKPQPQRPEPTEPLTPREVTTERFARMRVVLATRFTDRDPDRVRRIGQWVYAGGEPPRELTE